MQDAPGSELTVHDPGLVRCCSRHDGSNQCGGKGASYLHSLGDGRWSNICELGGWGRKKVIFRIDGEPAIRALGGAIHEETVIECRPKYSSPSMGPVENMNKELCGLVRCFRIYLREKAKMEITTESPLLPWLVRHCGWILSRYVVRADGRTGYSRLKGREYTSGVAIFGEAIWYMLPKTADLTKLDDRWRTAIWLGKSDRRDEHIIGLENGAVLARSVRRRVEGQRWNERALKMVTGTPWNPRPGEVAARWIDTVQPKAAVHASERVSNTQNDVGHDLISCVQERTAQSRPEPRRGSQLHQIQQHRISSQCQRQHRQQPSTCHSRADHFVTGGDETMEQEGPESKLDSVLWPVFLYVLF